MCWYWGWRVCSILGLQGWPPAFLVHSASTFATLWSEQNRCSTASRKSQPDALWVTKSKESGGGSFWIEADQNPLEKDAGHFAQVLLLTEWSRLLASLLSRCWMRLFLLSFWLWVQCLQGCNLDRFWKIWKTRRCASCKKRWLTHLVATWNQEMLAHIKKVTDSLSDKYMFNRIVFFQC